MEHASHSTPAPPRSINHQPHSPDPRNRVSSTQRCVPKAPLSARGELVGRPLRLPGGGKQEAVKALAPSITSEGSAKASRFEALRGVCGAVGTNAHDAMGAVDPMLRTAVRSTPHSEDPPDEL